jgi:hypothetical protein
MNYRQVARFSVDERLIRRSPEEVAEVFQLLRAVPVRAEAMFHEGTIEYIAISERFRDVNDGEEIPVVNLRVVKEGTSVSLVEVVYA